MSSVMEGEANSCLDWDSCSGYCPVCKEELADRWWPHIWVPPSSGGPAQLCHFGCVRNLLTGDDPSAAAINQAFARDLLSVITQSPQLEHRNPALRISFEEQRLNLAAASGKWHPWPPPEFPKPPAAAFAFEGIVEIRISGCSALRVLPPEIGHFRAARTLVLISNGLVALPEEVGALRQLQHLFVNGNFLRSLPAGVGALPNLEEVCFDANQLEALPDFVSRKMTLLTAPGNRLTKMPAVAGALDRLELHGNALASLTLAPRAPSEPHWDKMICLKIMGNRVQRLPPELDLMHWLRVLLVASNRLEALPDSVVELRWLEWLFAYDNRLRDLPLGLLLGSHRLERVLLEGNPLSATSTLRLLADEPQVHHLMLGLDMEQVAACAAASGPDAWRPLPRHVSVGRLIRVPGEGQYTLKLTRASQLRRAQGTLATGEPGGPKPPEAAPSPLLVVALAASQGEPEWLGLLRRLAERGRVALQPPPGSSMAEVLKGLDVFDTEACLSVLWAGCRRQALELGLATQEMEVSEGAPLGDFDVLSCIDHRMRWYSEDAPGFSQALSEICAPYSRVLFIGASMGGFGALRHGGHLGDAVMAFSPQADLPEATLRPPAADPQALITLSEQLFDSIRAGSSRGAQIDVHCAADEHLLHALSMPLAHLELTVHPLLPRKPFARILDRAGVLLPIVADAVARLLQAPARGPGAPRGGCRVPRPWDAGPQAAVACWRGDGRISRHPAEPPELVRLFFGPGGANLPRPGDWYCQRCSRRNMSAHFFCYRCGVGVVDAQVSAAGTVSIPGQKYPQKGDWGCGFCGQAQCSYQDSCSRCGRAKWGGHEQTVIVA